MRMDYLGTLQILFKKFDIQKLDNRWLDGHEMN